MEIDSQISSTRDRKHILFELFEKYDLLLLVGNYLFKGSIKQNDMPLWLLWLNKKKFKCHLSPPAVSDLMNENVIVQAIFYRL